MNKIYLGKYPIKFEEPLNTELKEQLKKQWIIWMLPLFDNKKKAIKLVWEDWLYNL